MSFEQQSVDNNKKKSERIIADSSGLLNKEWYLKEQGNLDIMEQQKVNTND